MKILVINSGSSSIKCQLFNMKEKTSLATGLVAQIGEPTQSTARLNFIGGEIEEKTNAKNHHEAFEILEKMLLKSKLIKSFEELDAVGHRVVQGGGIFKEPTLLDEQQALKIKDLSSLAPLHNLAHYAGIKAIMDDHPNVPQVAVFDTAFHQTMPKHAFMYAIPQDLYKKYQIRRYGFHGTSHSYVAKEAAKFLGKDYNKFNAISFHLGNGSSICAIKNGKSIDTSMGLTPLAGIMMGTRSGDLDPEIVLFLQRQGMSADEISVTLNKQSGLKAICGFNDLRDVLKRSKEGDENSHLALDMFAYQSKKVLGAYFAILTRLDAIIFTGGIGENAPITREKITSNLEIFGISVCHKKNVEKSEKIRDISSNNAKIKTLVVPTNEELEIANLTMNLVQKNLVNGS